MASSLQMCWVCVTANNRNQGDYRVAVKVNKSPQLTSICDAYRGL